MQVAAQNTIPTHKLNRSPPLRRWLTCARGYDRRVPAQPLNAHQRAEQVARQNPTAAEEFRRRLSDAIERLIEDGSTYAELSVDRLVNEADIGRSTFYKYFGDKTGLLSSLISTVQADFLRAANAWLAMTAGGTKSDYRSSFRAIFDAYRTHRAVMSCIAEQAPQDPVIGKQFREMMEVYVDAVRRHIEDGQQAGVINNAQPASQLAVWLTWMFEYGQLQLIGPADSPTVEKYTSAITDIVWKTLYSEMPPDG